MSLPPFEQVVADHGLTVLRVCRGLVCNEDAEEIWSETFLAALTAYPKLRADSNVRGWLVTIAHNKAIDRQRANRRAPVPTGALRDIAAVDSGVGESNSSLWEAVASLPPKQRSALALHYVADLPYSQVASLLEISEAASRRAASDGLARLRGLLEKEA